MSHIQRQVEQLLEQLEQDLLRQEKLTADQAIKLLREVDLREFEEGQQPSHLMDPLHGAIDFTPTWTSYQHHDLGEELLTFVYNRDWQLLPAEMIYDEQMLRLLEKLFDYAGTLVEADRADRIMSAVKKRLG